MTNREVELLAVGGGPANLALAVAIEELGVDGLAENSLVIERGHTVEWQRGLLLPWTKSQVAFAKDLVTLRNPRSKFTFLNYLHTVGRLDDFINMGSFTPYRSEISGYLSWVAESLRKVKFELDRECTSIAPVRDSDGTLTGWLTKLADGSTISSRYLTVGAGRDPYVPPVLAGLPADRLIHSTQYRYRMAEVAKDRPHRVAVVGAAQSAAEMFRALQTDLPNSDVNWVMRSIGLRAYDTNKFTNELYYPSFIDKVFDARPEGREQILREMHLTNYSGVETDLLQDLYTGMYLDKLGGVDRRRLVTMTDITGAREEGDEVVLELTDRRSDEVTELRLDYVFLGTGFVREMPAMVRDLSAAIGLDQISVTRQYRLELNEPSDAACYLQGVNEATHGIADSLLSVLGNRAGVIAGDLLARRAGQTNGVHRAGTEEFAAMPISADGALHS
ncbi:SidA/IucD/PvdA family monooxygenase [Streptomyces sp. SID13031]|uniref:SidA/IucD/PvdA family monooxygenase n=1 Tax=Streptomyces sp. SID13031 TaxID=2706046 RepID=UPI0013C922B0|nr:SidA/IucD/PvdA family monooxygenase [Streptomyces sp. SID13031]NEA30235.1 SidA/IucD/PvdA family monooxygenase [Streptomyces sp. SID13031]